MAVRKHSIQQQTPMSQQEYQSHLQSQAEERIRRGFTGFTRPERGEEVRGRTAGEHRLGTTQRHSQVGRRKK